MSLTQSTVVPTSADIVLDALSETRWRVLDARVPDESPAVVLGFICTVAGVYEVTTIARPLEVRYCTDLAAARGAVLDVH